MIEGKTVDLEQYYMSTDVEFLANNIMMDIAFLAMNWRHMLGRPTYVIVASDFLDDQGKIPLAMVTTMKKLKSGYINGTRVTLGNLNDFLSTSCITNLSFLGSQEDGMPDRLNPQVEQYLEEHMMKCLTQKSTLLKRPVSRNRTLRRRMSVKGAIKKTRSIINIEPDHIGFEQAVPVTPTAETSAVSSPVNSPWKAVPRSPSPEDITPLWKINQTPRLRMTSETQYADTEVEELLTMLRESEHLESEDFSILKLLQSLMTSETQYADTEVEELLTMLRESENLESEDFFNFKTFTKLVERSKTQYADTEVEELLTMLRESENLESEDFFNFKTFTKLVERSKTQYADTEVEELLTMLRESEHLESEDFFNFKTFTKLVERSKTQYADTEVEELLTMLRDIVKRSNELLMNSSCNLMWCDSGRPQRPSTHTEVGGALDDVENDLKRPVTPDTEVEKLLTMLRESEHLESEDFFNFKTFTKLVKRSNELLMVQMTSETQYADNEVEVLLTMLRESEHLESDNFFNFKTFTKLVERSNELLMDDLRDSSTLTLRRSSDDAEGVGNLESEDFFNFKLLQSLWRDPAAINGTVVVT
ncbi:Phosphorylase b kinase regulatory subunit alpha [Homalodisca vitripennis]|nr:Phosphorylase b kinase regulatory subunit alpha [Homalodisca vitripennis]